MCAEGRGMQENGGNEKRKDSNSSVKHTPLIKRLVARVLYEATLQDLLQAQNYAVFHLLREHNNLVDECRVTGEYIAYNHMDFFNPPEQLLPYITTPNGGVLQLHVSRPTGAHYPEDRCQFEVGAQTIGADAANFMPINNEVSEVQAQGNCKHSIRENLPC
ncbi:hypothetical protein V8E53_002095 [Lactarius tabidus]